MDYKPAFRIGTTSYIIPDDILPNVHFLAGQVQDVELVLFEVDDGPNNLPTAQTIQELYSLTQKHDLSYTVHLPLDLRLADATGEQHPSLVKARKVIERTQALAPWAYVLHLDGHEFIPNPSSPGLEAWQTAAARALELVGVWAGGVERLAVENLDNYPPEFWSPVLERVPASRCIDIGHLWKDGVDPLPFLERHLERARVLHIHGIGTRDHQSLARMLPTQLDAVLALLIRKEYRGVMTLEVFGEEDFHSSMQSIQESLGRLMGKSAVTR
jgi:sugar phosphate isomerase/epimerase